MAARANIVIDQGADFQTTIDVVDLEDNVIDLTGYTGEAQIRKHYSSTNAVSFTVEIDANNGLITLTLPATASANMSPGRYVYDLRVTNSDDEVSRITEGYVTVTPMVSR